MKAHTEYKPASLSTARMTLRPFAEQDGKLLQELFRDPEVTNYLPWGHPYSEAEAEQRLQQMLTHWREHRFGTYAVRPKAGERSIGYAGLETVAGAPFVEVLYAFSRRSWGKGYASEAAAACLKFGFENLGLPVIVGVTAPGNIRSKQVLEKIGMRPALDLDFYGKWPRYFSLSKEQHAARVE